MRDIINVFFGFEDRRGKSVYNLVNTNDTFPGSNSPYNSTTTTVNANKDTNLKDRSLNTIAVVDRILFKGKLSQEQDKTKCVLITVFVGLTAISLGALLLVFSPYEFMLKVKTTFAEGAEGFEMWRNPPAPIYLKVYLYNITNRDAFMAGTEKLRVQEVGPYVYREIGVHSDTIFNDNGTVTATPKYPLEWVPELSNGREDDILVLPNVAVLSFANVIAPQNSLTRMAVNFLIAKTNSHPIVEQTAKEFMFGYESPLVTLGNTFIPNWIYFDKLGLIDRMYDFTNDISTTYTGETDNHLSGILATYNRSPVLPQWQAPCNKLAGSSDGTKFQTGIKLNESLSFFRKSMCRSMPMVRTGAPFTTNGISTVHYKFKDDALDNGEINADNKCFCYNGRCLPRGMIDVMHCYYGFPIALSYPHFYMADAKLRENVEGTNPSEDLHATYFHINPETGTPTKVSVKMQINIALGDVSGMMHCERFTNMIIPMLWTDITMPQLNEMLTIKLFLLLRVLPIVEAVALYLLLICGVAFILLGLFAAVFISTVKTVPASQNNIVKKRRPINLNLKKAEYLTQEKIPESNKEMDVYFCSLLTQNSENDTS